MDENSNEYSIQDSLLVIADSTLRFDFPIGKILEISNMLIVCLSKLIGIVYNENVFGISLREKKIKWQIAKNEYNPNMKSCPFVDVRFFQGQLILYNWCDIDFVVDPATGEILEEGWTK